MTRNSSVPDELLQNLRCSLCTGYLSVFPIYIKIDDEHPICGRCRIPNEEEYLRDNAYEGIAQFMDFPCCHAKNGCEEHMTPLKLINHEQCCLFKLLDCPTKIVTECGWQGSTKDLKKHFEAFHHDLLLTSGIFEVSFIDSVKETMLLPVDNDELFLVKKEINSRTGSFECVLQQVVQSETPVPYNYFIRVAAGDNTYFHKSPVCSTSPASAEKIRFTLDFLKKSLRNPAVIVAYIDVIKATDAIACGYKPKVEEKNPEVNWDALAGLECPVCFEYMLAPIYQCYQGHSLCSNCKPQVTWCPLCRENIGNTQNFILQDLISRMSYPCKYHNLGCSTVLKSADIKDHEQGCQYGSYVCPLKELENCDVNYTKSDIVAHVEECHEAYILKSDKIHIPIGTKDKYYIIKYCDKIFKLCFLNSLEKFYWTVQFIGPTEECKSFKYEIDVIDNSHNNLRQCIRGRCSNYSKQEECFQDKGNYIVLHQEQIEEFLNENLSFRVRVLKE